MNISRSVTVAAAWSKACANRSKKRNRSKSRKNFMAVFSPQHQGPQPAALDVNFPTVFMHYLRNLLAGLAQIPSVFILRIFICGAICVGAAQAQQPEAVEKKVDNPIGAAE